MVWDKSGCGCVDQELNLRGWIWLELAKLQRSQTLIVYHSWSTCAPWRTPPKKRFRKAWVRGVGWRLPWVCHTKKVHKRYPQPTNQDLLIAQMLHVRNIYLRLFTIHLWPKVLTTAPFAELVIWPPGRPDPFLPACMLLPDLHPKKQTQAKKKQKRSKNAYLLPNPELIIPPPIPPAPLQEIFGHRLWSEHCAELQHSHGTKKKRIKSKVTNSKPAS